MAVFQVVEEFGSQVEQVPGGGCGEGYLGSSAHHLPWHSARESMVIDDQKAEGWVGILVCHSATLYPVDLLLNKRIDLFGYYIQYSFEICPVSCARILFGNKSSIVRHLTVTIPPRPTDNASKDTSEASPCRTSPSWLIGWPKRECFQLVETRAITYFENMPLTRILV